MHELSDDHDWLAACDHALQAENVDVMVQLSHNTRFIHQVTPLMLTCALFQRLHCNL